MLFNTTTAPNEEYYSEIGDVAAPRGATALWTVDHRTAHNPSLQFQRESSPLIEQIIDNSGGVTPLAGVTPPVGLMRFLKETFLPPFGMVPSKHSSLDVVIHFIMQYIDYQEPYMYFIDMPIQLSQDEMQFTYRHKRTGSVLDPSKTEVFHVMRQWDFKPYWAAKDILENERVRAVLAGQQIWSPKLNRVLNVDDVLEQLALVVYGGYGHFKGCVEDWIWNYADELCFDVRTGESPESVDGINACLDADTYYWYVVALGVFTWLKSPHGLKFLAQYHPVYYEVLMWDEDIEKIVVRPDTGGIAVVDGWTIFTMKDLAVSVNEPPGTCSVLKQQLHCVKLVNVPAVKSRVCYCGKELKYLSGDYHGDHYTPACYKWRKEHEDQDAFISYGALHNLLTGLDMKTRCPEHKCPNTKCNLHAGNYMRVRSLTEQRIRMIPQQGSPNN